MGHACWALLQDIRIEYLTSCWTLLSDALAWNPCQTLLTVHSSLTLLLNALDKTLFCDTLVGTLLNTYSCLALLLDSLVRTLLLARALDRALFWNTLAKHFCQNTVCQTLLKGQPLTTLCLDTLVGHSYWTLFAKRSWQGTLARHSYWTLFARHSFLTLFTLAWHSCLMLFAWHSLPHALAWHSFKTSIFHEPFTKSQTSKMIISHETVTKTGNRDFVKRTVSESDFQTEHFPRDFHQKWKARLPKQAFFHL